MLQQIKMMHEKFKMQPSDIAFSDKEKQFRITAMQ